MNSGGSGPAEGKLAVKIRILSTDEITELDGVPVRVWQGVTEQGARCFVFVHRIAVCTDEDATEFDRQLSQTLRPGQTVPLRVVLSSTSANSRRKVPVCETPAPSV